MDLLCLVISMIRYIMYSLYMSDKCPHVHLVIFLQAIYKFCIGLISRSMNNMEQLSKGLVGIKIVTLVCFLFVTLAYCTDSKTTTFSYKMPCISMFYVVDLCMRTFSISTAANTQGPWCQAIYEFVRKNVLPTSFVL